MISAVMLPIFSMNQNNWLIIGQYIHVYRTINDQGVGNSATALGNPL